MPWPNGKAANSKFVILSGNVGSSPTGTALYFSISVGLLALAAFGRLDGSNRLAVTARDEEKANVQNSPCPTLIVVPHPTAKPLAQKCDRRRVGN